LLLLPLLRTRFFVYSSSNYGKQVEQIAATNSQSAATNSSRVYSVLKVLATFGCMAAYHGTAVKGGHFGRHCLSFGKDDHF
jgi:hypothetical protein